MLALIAFGFPNTTQIFEPARVAEEQLPAVAARYPWRPSPVWAVAISILLIACLYRLEGYSEFLYFNF